MSSPTIADNAYNVHGFTTTGWESVREAFKQNFIEGLDIGASLCVYHRGQCVVDLCGGWKDPLTKKEPYTADTLQVVCSVSKGVMGVAVALCVDRGWLDYDVPVVEYWPEFGANGKEKVTVGQLLAHRAGIPCLDRSLTFDEVLDWNKMTSLSAAQKPFWEPGTQHGYHSYTYGFLSGELIRRVDPQHRSYGQFVHDELDKDIHFGITDDTIERRVARLIRKPPPDGTPFPAPNKMRDESISCNGALPISLEDKFDFILNRVETHRVEIPAANGITNARSLARIYALLLGDIEENNQKRSRLISEKTLQRAMINLTPDGERDQVLFAMLNKFSQSGFHLYSDAFEVCGPGVFGHKGIGGSCALAYPAEQLSFAHVLNHMDVSSLGIDRRTNRLIDAIKTALQKELTL